MKKSVLFLLFPFFSLVSNAQEITGAWQGMLVAGEQKIRTVFHIKSDSGHLLHATFDSPDQGAIGIQCSKTDISGNSLEIIIEVIGGGYRGKWDGKNLITGYFFQHGSDFPMNLFRSLDTAVHGIVRPQTPRPPFPYNSEDIEYSDPVTGNHFGATITYPKSGGPFPAALLITGSGQEDRDETMLGHKPFAVIADYLTRRGYAVMRVDDRQTGKSTGDLTKATTADFAKDVEVSFRELKKRKDIDPGKIGLIGHSEGGLIAQMLAAENNNIDFIIMLAGPGVKIAELMELQNEAFLRSVGASDKVALSYKMLVAGNISAVLSSTDSTRQFETAWNSFVLWKKTADPETIRALGLNDDDNAAKFIQSQLHTFNTPWMKYFLSVDPAVYLQKLHCKVLALDGARDIQVLPDQNLAAIDSSLKLSQVKIYSTQKLPGLNHLFQHCHTCTVAEYGELNESFSSGALEIIGDWLDKNVK